MASLFIVDDGGFSNREAPILYLHYKAGSWSLVLQEGPGLVFSSSDSYPQSSAYCGT